MSPKLTVIDFPLIGLCVHSQNNTILISSAWFFFPQYNGFPSEGYDLYSVWEKVFHGVSRSFKMHTFMYFKGF